MCTVHLQSAELSIDLNGLVAAWPNPSSNLEIETSRPTEEVIQLPGHLIALKPTWLHFSSLHTMTP
jgi:hypothetical protein